MKHGLGRHADLRCAGSASGYISRGLRRRHGCLTNERSVGADTVCLAVGRGGGGDHRPEGHGLFTHRTVGILSDALESLVNLVAALLALAMLKIAARPADAEHAYGHSKAEYFSSGVKGTLITLAALAISVAAVGRLHQPQPLERLGLGAVASLIASLINLGTATVLLRAGKRVHSITLEAEAYHLFSDVWTTGGVLVGIGLVALTGWKSPDPVAALLVAANIIRTGVGIVRRSILGLMDTALPAGELESVRQVLTQHLPPGVEYHASWTRRAGARRFASIHVLVPGNWTVHQGHQLLERLETDMRQALPNLTVFTHLESLDDPTSWDDMTLDREQRAQFESMPDPPGE